MTLDASSILWLAAILIVASLVAGFLAGLFGIGGGAVTVPVLFSAFNAFGVDQSLTMHMAVGTSLALIIPTSIRSLFAHMRKGAVDRTLLRQWLIAVPLGAVAGGFLAAILSSEGLRGVFAVIAFVLGIRMAIGRLPFKLGDDLPGRLGRSIAGFIIGAISAIMGIGGGVLNNTFMTLYGRPIHQAVATSAGVGLLIALPGVIPYVGSGWGEAGLPPFSLGYVNLVALAVLIPLSMLAVPWGTTLAHRLTQRQLQIGFAIFLFSVSARFAWSLL
ncbi:sulfite exporter TauE/SafE family protein [Aureimonas mangrovi]|uniref:sulfite exporter TauE/SafE family protein n=1 Tax=Aureimonas mangrovi TaxID=2758041 RepID=UPI00163D585A|nr:sulfite exporter TauE/SafE family protein [Aureimonas mangrovi]